MQQLRLALKVESVKQNSDVLIKLDNKKFKYREGAIVDVKFYESSLG